MLKKSDTDNGKDIGDPRSTYEIQHGSQTGSRDIRFTSRAAVDDAIFTRRRIDQEDRKVALQKLTACWRRETEECPEDCPY